MTIFSDSPSDQIRFWEDMHASLHQEAVDIKVWYLIQKKHLSTKYPEESPTALGRDLKLSCLLLQPASSNH